MSDERRVGIKGLARRPGFWPGLVTALLLALFVVTAGFFALRLQRDVIPDESAHLAISEAFAGSWGVPLDSSATYAYGSVQRKPYLYYWLNARLLNALDQWLPRAGNWRHLAALRLLNVAYASLAVLFCWLLARELGLGRWWRVLVVFLLTNTLMFTFLAGGVNYDNLANLCSFAGLYFWARVIRGRPFLSNSLAWLACLLVGTLVKFTLLPLLLVMGLVWLVFILRARPTLDLRAVRRWPTALPLVAVILLAVLNLSLYGVNLLRYHAVLPSCTQLLTPSQCAQSPIYQRDQAVYLAEPLSLADMFNGNVPDPLVWFDQYWSGAMLGMIYGAVGHKSVVASDLAVSFFRLWLVWLAVLALRYVRKPSVADLALLAVVLGYLLVLLQTNLSSELGTGFKHLGTQGRYLFPVLSGLYVLLVCALAAVPHRALAGATLLGTLALFVVNSPLWILTVPTPVTFPSGAIQPEAHTIRLEEAESVSQDFQSECPGALTQVEVLFAGPADPLTQPVEWRLVDQTTGQEVAHRVADATIPYDQTWLALPLDGLTDSKDHFYRLTVRAPQAQAGQGPVLWNTTHNVYRGGDAEVHGVLTNQDLVFRYTCRMPLLAGWFNDTVR